MPCGIMMEHANIPYPIAIPLAGVICFVVGFLFGFPALRLKGVYLALATFALAVAAPPLFKLGTFEHWTGGVQGLLVTKPERAVRPEHQPGPLHLLPDADRSR